jgi:GT2 family glycosyltransferase
VTSLREKVAAVVLSWNGGDELLDALRSLLELERPPDTLFVVDNGSPDDSAEIIESLFKEVVLIRSATNLGFAGGVNLGIARALSEGFDYVLLLNSDALAPDGLIDDLLAEAHSDERVGIVGAVLVNFDDRSQIQAIGGGRVNLWTGMSRHILTPGESIDYLTGACLLLRATMLREIGPFDDSYFFYWEDVDLSRRAVRAGWRLAISARVRVPHVEASSLGRFSEGRAFRLFEGQVRFMRAHAAFPLLPVVGRLCHQTAWCLFRGHWSALKGAWRGAFQGWRS